MQGLAIPSRRTLLAADVAIKVVTVGLLAWAVLYPDLPQFQGKAFAGRAIAYPHGARLRLRGHLRGALGVCRVRYLRPEFA